MDIGVPLRELGEYDIAPLRDVILAQDESVWLGNTYRQQAYEVHQQTQSIVMVFTDGAGWPDIEVRREPGWDVLAEQALPLMHRILADHYPPGGCIIRAMAARLSAGGVIKPHRDKHPSFHYGHRIHIPIYTNNRVRFMIDGRPYRMAVGTVYEINNQQQHSVMNKGREARINFIFDYVPPQHLGQSPSGRQRPGQERPGQERPGQGGAEGTSGIA
ncbi:MAG: aspartyl/asparaginyl beta-hydroxylase domain-containing protein [Pseudomonadales bacterium]|nr:aspartyl/asparaginyl beta-hydroxylase domain-containing protein [Halioglobus sp.]MCP5121908.1 aspartyl/asparaginyl beta-hydroxylase domain-containing protein [Pseudomonadales bacterium]MCP5192553.1 aspartyl/asparaginyl beta-hydroxylase domain-containing protein [Pseudomonadales bacterium]